MTTLCFAPFQNLADMLIPHTVAERADGSHDISHLHRVWKNVCAIRNKEGGDHQILLAATLLHDCVAVEKNSPFRASASRLAAAKATELLAEMGWDEERIQAVAHAVESHSYSASITPTTLEAKILQDADRLDAIGMVGVARLFYVSGRMGSHLYHPNDPHAQHRALDDKRYAVDHFKTKIFSLAEGFQTHTGRQMAQARHERTERFLREFMDEIAG
ncbi:MULTISPECIES: HD domain-containing protein [unclassified Pseudomonas]|uniref:HD domain-containing protein n=1 Tax=unclassified Pseudomonas TaxID=196821 RepID=UPI0025D6348C|nr:MULTISPECIES: HD domain-containing protein [unclassified Pseudomonas]